MNNKLNILRDKSQETLNRLQNELATTIPEKFKDHGLCIYACGSLGRLEFGDVSDLDAFYIIESRQKENGRSITKKDEKRFFSKIRQIHDKFGFPALFKNGRSITKKDEKRFFSKIRQIHDKFGFPAPSKNGKYLVFTSREDIFDIGSQEEDFKNSYTARMLLLLESRPLYNEEAYNKLVDDVVERYFIDYADHTDDFNPLYLMNDIKRYWYTLCLNYEYRRDENDDRAERYRKRLKLKFARRITCFSMLACLYKKGINKEYVVKCVKMTPFERFEMLAKGNEELTSVVEDIKQMYEHYLELKTHDTPWWEEKLDRKDSAFKNADEFQQLVNTRFMQKIANDNQNLLNLMDLY